MIATTEELGVPVVGDWETGERVLVLDLKRECLSLCMTFDSALCIKTKWPIVLYLSSLSHDTRMLIFTKYGKREI